MTRDIPIQIIRSRRKTIALEIKEDLSVLVRAPFHTTQEEIQGFIDSHRNWLTKKYGELEKAKEKRGISPCPHTLRAEERKRIAEYFLSRVQYYQQLMNLSCKGISIRNQKTRWGSCSSKGNLNFNYKLYYMPPEILDYVVVHELAHLKHMNHSREFWSYVGRYMPEYERHRGWLKDHGREY